MQERQLGSTEFALGDSYAMGDSASEMLLGTTLRSCADDCTVPMPSLASEPVIQ